MLDDVRQVPQFVDQASFGKALNWTTDLTKLRHHGVYREGCQSSSRF